MGSFVRKGGTFAGDNLGNSIYAKTGTGMVIDGGTRDLDGIYELPDFATFIRGVDPTATWDVDLTGINIPIRIGEATCLPGARASSSSRHTWRRR